MWLEAPEARVLRQLIEALAFERLIPPAPGGWEVAGLAIRAPHRIGGFGRVRLTGAPQGADRKEQAGAADAKDWEGRLSGGGKR